MSAYVCSAPGKLNLCLLVGRRRDDGYHPLVSIVQPVSLADEVRLEPHDGDADVVVCPGVEGDNLAAKALALYRQETGWDAPPQRLTIEKRIPVAAGMGGGSADAAAALRLAACAAGRPDDPAITEIAPRLGADVPSQVRPQRCLMTGIGGVVEPLPEPETHLGMAVLISPHHLSTAHVYAEFDRLGLGRSDQELAEAARQVRDGWGHHENDLEPAAISLCPPIEAELRGMREHGPLRVHVSGSGPTVYGLWSTADDFVVGARSMGAVQVHPVGPDFATPRAA